jgi:hypothetical protein
VAPGRPKPLIRPLVGQRAERAWGDVHYAVNFSS